VVFLAVASAGRDRAAALKAAAFLIRQLLSFRNRNSDSGMSESSANSLDVLAFAISELAIGTIADPAEPGRSVDGVNLVIVLGQSETLDCALVVGERADVVLRGFVHGVSDGDTSQRLAEDEGTQPANAAGYWLGLFFTAQGGRCGHDSTPI